jgi:hypothetical protein
MVTPTGSISLPMYYAKESVAASAAFQTWTTTADADAAKARIHYATADASATLPLCTITPAQDFGRRRAGTGNWVYMEGSAVLIHFEAAKAADDTIADALIDFQNGVDTILDDLEENTEIGGYLTFSEWRLDDGPYVFGSQEDEGQLIGERCGVDIMFMLEGF